MLCAKPTHRKVRDEWGVLISRPEDVYYLVPVPPSPPR